MKLQLKNKVSLFIWLCSVAFLFLPIYVFGQIPSHLELADSLFKQGVYASAKLNYELAMQLEDSKVDEKLGNAKLCSEYLTSGDDAFYKDRFEEAKSYFEKILRINPFDPNMADKIEACDKKAYAPSSEKQTDTIDLLYRDGYKIYQKGHYSPLSDRELRNIFAGTQSYIYYNRAMAKQTATTVLYPLGATAGVVASCFLVFTFGGLSMVPVYIIAASAGIILAGVCLDVSGRYDINKATETYNNSYSTSMHIGFTPNGIGLSLIF